MEKQIIILAAGKGSRMKSDLPKVMHKLENKSMLEHVVTNCSEVTKNLVLVYSDHLKPYLSQFEDRCTFVKQEEQLGTGHAVSVAKSEFKNNSPIAVIYGDNPLIKSDIINALFDHLEKEKACAITLAFEYDKENQYGRIILDKNGDFQEIIESKFANDEQKKITLCNSGVMAFAPNMLEKYIDKCLDTDPNNPERELYLTDIIKICNLDGAKVSYLKTENPNLVIGINTQEELLNALSKM